MTQKRKEKEIEITYAHMNEYAKALIDGLCDGVYRSAMKAIKAKYPEKTERQIKTTPALTDELQHAITLIMLQLITKGLKQ